MAVEQRNASSSANGEKPISQPGKKSCKVKAINSDSVIPNAPPTRQTSTASIRNCCKTSLARAPTAMRMPISRVRSVTDTSIIFITPIPPTTSEITATSVRNSCKVRVVFSTVFKTPSMFQVKKSFLPWRSESKRVSCCSASALSNPSFTLTVMELSHDWPITRPDIVL
ncbi:Uncharacterised protein [Shigella flexneri]|nr:Uncharacterised protein [Shigella flexneri]